MSEGHSKLSEVEKLIKKIDFIYTKLGGRPENGKKLIKLEYDSSKEKDEFERIRYEIRHKMNQVETYLQQRAVIQNEVDAKKILEKQTLSSKIDSDLQTINIKRI